MIVGYLLDFFSERPDEWERIDAHSDDDLWPGDIQIYRSNGHSHTNIYAGDGVMWDAGDETASSGAFIAEKRTSWETGGEAYTCSFRYRK